MNAIVSGRSGRALLLDGESLKSFEVDDPSTIVPRHRSELPYLFGETADLRTIKNTTIESVERELRMDCHFTWALDLALISLDAELEDDIRTDALEDLQQLLAESVTMQRLERVLYSKPLPEDADLNGALDLCDPQAQSIVFGFLRRLEERQPSILSVRHAWEIIPTRTFGGQENRETFEHVAVEEGLFHSLTKLDTAASVPSFQLKAGLNPSVQRLPNHRQVLLAWTAPFRGSREVSNVVTDEEEDVAAEEGRFGKRRRIDRRAVLREAVKKKSIIVEAMHRKDLARVDDLVDELVSYHQSYSESQHTAKSLCDLAMEAKAIGLNSLQLALTERSISIAPGDGWSWVQHADALLGLQRFDEALKAYEQAEVFGRAIMGRKGRAEVLKAQGQFAAALAIFDEVIREHPDDVVAKTGRAEVLKAQGQFAAALTAFDEIIRQHPDDVFAKNGRAEVLKAQGQFAAALTAFDETIRQHPNDVVAKNGRAEVLKAQGQFAAALTAFDETIRQHPDDVVAKTGRAEVLKAQGQFAAALTAFDETIRQHPDNVIAKTGRAEVLKTQGQFAAALTAFDEVIRQHPEHAVAKTGRAEVLKAQGQFAAALTAFDEVIRQHPEHVVAKTGRAEVLKTQGQFAAALTAFDETIRQHPDNAVAKTGRAEVLKAQGQFAAALTAFDETIRQHPDDAVAKTGRAEVLKAQGQFAAALTAFDETIRQHPDNVVAKTGRAEVLKTQGQFAAALTAFDETIRQHPEDVVAKTGRAEVLKAQGQFAAALTAFDEVIRQHPHDPVASNGRSCVLVALGYYNEALESLPTTAPIALEEWIAYHIRGMCLLRTGETAGAVKIFNDGLQNCPFSSQREYFRSALALSWLRGRDFRKAGETLESVTWPLLQQSANVIRIHAFGAQGNRQRALKAYEDLAAAPHLLADELTQELHHQYVLLEEPTKDEEWIFDREVRIFLRAEAA